MQDNSFKNDDKIVIGTPITGISREFSEFLSVIICKWILVRLIHLYQNDVNTTIDEKIITKLGNDLFEELERSISKIFTEKHIQLDLLIDYIEHWKPDFVMASQHSKSKLH